MSALTAAELLAIWQGVVDPSYSEPLIRLGDGKGLEVYGQALAQLQRVSQAIDTTTQSTYILPSSAQSAPPAAGAQLATVAMQVQRSVQLQLPLILGAGQVWVEERAPDWGLEPGQPGEVVGTGRLYTALLDLVLMPGQGLVAVAFAGRSERPGWGYNNPAVGTITGIQQPGASFSGSVASVVQEGAADYLEMSLAGDPLVPAHVGQYIEFIGGSNAGQVRRVVAYGREHGGRVRLERSMVAVGTLTGTPLVGEQLYQAATGASATVVAWTATSLLMVDQAGIPMTTGALVGPGSGASFTPSTAPVPAALVPEVGTAAWRVLDWARDLGVLVANTAKPVGGRLGMLDAWGQEHNLPRATGEPDDQYRQRVATIADLISPNAVRRGVNRALYPYGVGCELREPGSALLPGFFYDHDAYDYGAQTIGTDAMGAWAPVGFWPGDVVTQTDPMTGQVAAGIALCRYITGTAGYYLSAIEVRSGTFVEGLPILSALRPDGVTRATFTPAPGQVGPGMRAENRYRWEFALGDTRAFFLVEIPRVNAGEFGFAYDAGYDNAYDLMAPHATGYSGWPAGQAVVDRTAWQAANAARAAGVGLDLILTQP
jgi:hypothetical protein